MARTSLVLLVAALCVAGAVAESVTHHGSNWNPQAGDFEAWMAKGGKETTLHGHEEIPELRQKLVKRILNWATEELMTAAYTSFDDVKAILNHKFDEDETPEDLRHLLELVLESEELTPLELNPATGAYQSVLADPYPYFGFIPPYLQSLIPDAPAMTWSTDCWGTNSATAATQSDGSVLISITVAHQKEFLCSDSYLMASTGGLHFGFKVSSSGTHTLTWNTTGYTPADTYDLKNKGIRMYHFTDNFLATIGQVIDTALMFLPLTTKGVAASAAARNMQFLKDYAHVDMANRSIHSVPLDASLIHSGDFFGIIRLDGLDPMLGWAMGSTTGHTTTALWDNGQLYVAESTANDSYWPVNGIQRTPYEQWIKQATEAGFNVVHVPLNAEYRAKYNVTAAIDFFHQTEGLNYGYHNMFWGWIDTVKDNYPCVPPDFSSKCLQWELLEPAFGFLNKAVPKIANMFYAQAFNFRMGTKGLTTAEIYMMAEKKGMNTNVIPTIVEEDSWKYQTTRYGKPAVGESMVCCVFVCHMWKAAGLFGDDVVNCGELTNFDDYVLDIFDKNATLPAQCTAADPGNPLCQILGAQTLHLNDYNTKAPYTHMAEHCPSEAPLYKRPANC